MELVGFMGLERLPGGVLICGFVLELLGLAALVFSGGVAAAEAEDFFGEAESAFALVSAGDLSLDTESLSFL